MFTFYTYESKPSLDINEGVILYPMLITKMFFFVVYLISEQWVFIELVNTFWRLYS